MHLSFVRSGELICLKQTSNVFIKSCLYFIVTMDKWKDLELEKMKVGGNQKAREFFESQEDYDDNMNINQKYNTRAAALYRDKILTLAQGKDWDMQSALKTVQFNKSSSAASSNSSAMPHSRSSGQVDSYQNGGGYQESIGYQNFNSQEFKDQKEDFFSRKQNENANRPELVMTI